MAYLELTNLLYYTIDGWIEKYYPLHKWRNYRSEIETKIHGCIRCYRYTGSFVGYLYKTLAYSGRGLAPVSSLDKPLFDGEATLLDFITEDQETGIYSVFGK